MAAASAWPPAAHAEPAEPALPALRFHALPRSSCCSALLRLMQPLLSLVAAHQATVETPVGLLWATHAAARVLLLLLKCANTGQLVLGDADALRLLSAAPLVLRMQPQTLRVFSESVRNGGLTAQFLSEANPSRMLEVNAQTVHLLVTVRWLPVRAVAAARATSLRPEALCSWLVGPGSVMDVIASLLHIVGEAPRRARGRRAARARQPARGFGLAHAC